MFLTAFDTVFAIATDIGVILSRALDITTFKDSQQWFDDLVKEMSITQR